ncbi:hypothetical protein [Schlesneria sp.]
MESAPIGAYHRRSVPVHGVTVYGITPDNFAASRRKLTIKAFTSRVPAA